MPFATTASIASSTEPGASIDVMVWMYGPITDAGLYRAHWRLHQLAESIDFGPVLSFEYVVDENVCKTVLIGCRIHNIRRS